MIHFWQKLGIFWQIVVVIVVAQFVEFGLYKLGIIEQYRPIIQMHMNIRTEITKSADQVPDNGGNAGK